MKTGAIAICGLSVIPVRAKPDDTSEIVTQLLFGEKIEYLEIQNQWIKVEIAHDQYVGWIDHKQVLELSDNSSFLLHPPSQYQQEAALKLETPWGIQTILKGSPILSPSKNFTIDGYQFKWIDSEPKQYSKDIIELAKSYLNAPYLWGGRTPFGIDCSGFSQTVYHQIGYRLNRDASQQVLQGSPIHFEEQKPGDLAFFASEKTGNITHVGIILPEHKIIHAHGRVRIDTLNEKGIFNEKKAYYSHQFHSIRRYDI
nr:C40 family peptidase [uncultured Brumimicrobium sp.]